VRSRGLRFRPEAVRHRFRFARLFSWRVPPAIPEPRICVLWSRPSFIYYAPVASKECRYIVCLNEEERRKDAHFCCLLLKRGMGQPRVLTRAGRRRHPLHASSRRWSHCNGSTWFWSRFLAERYWLESTLFLTIHPLKNKDGKMTIRFATLLVSLLAGTFALAGEIREGATMYVKANSQRLRKLGRRQ
jgi:hypothetical protein